MIKFYIQNKQHIINLLIIVAIIISVIAPDNTFVRDASLGFAAGAALINFLSGLDRTDKAILKINY